LAKRRGATTIAMCGESKTVQVREVGADAVLPRSPEDLRGALHDAIGTDQVDVVADVVGGTMFGPLIDALKRGGRYTCAGAIAGAVVEFDLRTFYLNDLTFTGATIPAVDIFPSVVGYIEKGEIRPLLAQTYALEDFYTAQQAFIDKQHVGNIVVSPK
jgi:NADPH:quinone reductase-like Zn-dependent oxidoreductase